MHHDSFWTMFPVMSGWWRWRSARVTKHREMMWENKYTETETSQRVDPQPSICWRGNMLCTPQPYVTPALHFLSLCEKEFLLFVAWALIWWNCWDSGAAIVLSILLCWLSDSETSTNTCSHITRTVLIRYCYCKLARILRLGETKLGFTSEWQHFHFNS